MIKEESIFLYSKHFYEPTQEKKDVFIYYTAQEHLLQNYSFYSLVDVMVNLEGVLDETNI